MTRVHNSGKRQALIIGGSLGGLFVGNLLCQIGWDVDIFERSAHDLDSRGGGIVLQPEVVEVFRRGGVDIRIVDLGVRSEYRAVFRPDGSIESKHFAPQTQTSWSLIYTTLKAACGDRNYHQAKTLMRVDQDPEERTVTAHFEDGSCETGHLLVGAKVGTATGCTRQVPSPAGIAHWRLLAFSQIASCENWVTLGCDALPIGIVGTRAAVHGVRSSRAIDHLKPAPKSSEIPPLFKADTATVSFDAAKAEKLSRGFQDCEQIGSFEKSGVRGALGAARYRRERIERHRDGWRGYRGGPASMRTIGGVSKISRGGWASMTLGAERCRRLGA